MDIQQTREAFLLPSRIEDEIRHFRHERLRLIDSGEAPARLPTGPKLVVHSVPFQSVALERASVFDVPQLRRASSQVITAVSPGPLSPGPNLDGWRVSPVHGAQVVQMFRNGALEFVEGEIVEEVGEDCRLDEDLEADVPALLRPILDMVSQAAGYEGTSLFNDEGKWRGRT